jgi:dTMP kinase
LLAEALRAAGLGVLQTREPGGSPGAEALRGLLLSGETDWAPLAETMLHFAARAEHVARAIRPALEAGNWVVCDRFSDSTLAYQGYGQGADLEMTRSLARMIGLAPDLTIVLDVSDAIASARLRVRGGDLDRYERRDAAFHARVKAGFRAVAEAEPTRCALISADGTPAEVHAAVMQMVHRRLGLPAPMRRDPT